MKSLIKSKLKKITVLKYLVIVLRFLAYKPSLLIRISGLISYFNDLKKFQKINSNKSFSLKTVDLFARIYDKTSITSLDPVYYLQGTWCAKKIFENHPSRHYDIGSQALMVGIISQFTPTTMVDIRPLSIELNNLSFIKGDITSLPFPDKSINSLSSICVIEHIGLGRYGDPIDAYGTEKAIKELTRVLAQNGSLYISVPIDTESKIYFNAHRAFSRAHILNLFKDLKLKEEKYIYGNSLFDQYDSQKGFGTGLYYFQK